MSNKESSTYEQTADGCEGDTPVNFSSEVNEINGILNQMRVLGIDHNFSIMNNGVSYPLGNDSKIVSKIYEIIIIDKLKGLLEAQDYKYIENDIQNKYPDFIIISKIQEEKFYAVDIKSSYMKTKTEINGFTLGTYKGYFKNRDSMVSIVKPYNHFIKHFCICVIYSPTE